MRKLLGAAVAAGLMLCAGQANADLVSVTYTGTASGNGLGFFGPSLQAFTNSPFTAIYRFDELPTAADPGGDFGSFLGLDITIQGQTWSIAPDGHSYLYSGDGSAEGFWRGSSIAFYEDPHIPEGLLDRYIVIGNSLITADAPEDRTDPFSGTGYNSRFYGNGVVLYHRSEDRMRSYEPLIRFITTGVTVSAIEAPSAAGPGVGWFTNYVALPEPSTWAAMLLGFFGTGVALRTARSRRQATAAQL